MSTTVLQRLRAAGLTPTIARIGMLQVLKAAAPRCLSAEDLFHQMLLRGTRVSVGTIYRVLHQLDGAGLLRREWSRQRKALYGFKPDGVDAGTVQLVCRHTGRSLALADGALHAQLIAAAACAGVDLGGQALTVTVDHLPPAPDSARAPVPNAQAVPAAA